MSRWDTCAAQAVLEAHGGCLAKLSAFAAAESRLDTYRYVPSATNADFEPGLPRSLTCTGLQPGMHRLQPVAHRAAARCCRAPSVHPVRAALFGAPQLTTPASWGGHGWLRVALRTL